MISEYVDVSRPPRRDSCHPPARGLADHTPSRNPCAPQMISAHAGYWQDSSFASFVLAEIFATPTDLARTGMAISSQMDEQP